MTTSYKKSKKNYFPIIIVFLLLTSGCKPPHNESSSEKNDVLSRNKDIPQESSQKKIQVLSRYFPTGEFNAQEVILEVKGGPTFRMSEMDLFEGVARVSTVGENRIKMVVSVKLRREPGGQTKEDKRLDLYRVLWSDDSHGSLVNEDQRYPTQQHTL